MKKRLIFGLTPALCSLLSTGCSNKKAEGTTIIGSAEDKIFGQTKSEELSLLLTRKMSGTS